MLKATLSGHKGEDIID